MRKLLSITFIIAVIAIMMVSPSFAQTYNQRLDEMQYYQQQEQIRQMQRYQQQQALAAQQQAQQAEYERRMSAQGAMGQPGYQEYR